MKVAVSIPDPIFAEADALAQRLNTSRSRLYARALEAYVDRHDPDWITNAINKVIDEIGEEPDDFNRMAARRVFERTEG